MNFCFPTWPGPSPISWILFRYWPDLSSFLVVSLSLISERKYLSVCFLNLFIYKRVIIIIGRSYYLWISCDGLPFCLVSVSAISSNCGSMVPVPSGSDFLDLAPWFFRIILCCPIFKIVLLWDYNYRKEYLFVDKCLTYLCVCIPEAGWTLSLIR